MPGYNNLIEIPTRIPLASQVADVIRSSIRRGVWTKDLPNERQLSSLLNVSRPTLRVALHLLAKDGLIEIRERQKKRVLSGCSHASASPKKTVGIITHAEITHLAQSNYIHISDLIGRLAERGLAVEIFVCKPTVGVSQSEKLADFLRTNRVLCCILLSVSQAVQRWFSVRSLPALVLGSCHEMVRLPSVDINLRASCRHAAGTFLKHGHRRLALILPDSGLAGDIMSERGFSEAVDIHNATARDEARCLIVRHNDTASGVTAKLRILFRSAEPPTALLSVKPWHTITVIIFLLNHGFAVPNAVSIIARDQDLLLDSIAPQVSHYRFRNSSFTLRAANLVLKIVRQHDLPAAASLIMPDFFEGETVARCRP